MCRREVFDDFLRKRAKENGAKLVNGLFMGFDQPEGPTGPVMGEERPCRPPADPSRPRRSKGSQCCTPPGAPPTCFCLCFCRHPCVFSPWPAPSPGDDSGPCMRRFHVRARTNPPVALAAVRYNDYDADSKGKPTVVEVDCVIGADGANSRVAKEIDAGEYDYAIAFQERIRIPDDKMDYYKDLAEMYVGDDVSPDFYGWVFPKYDHVAVGTGTVINKTAIKQYQQATRDRAAKRIEGGKIIRVEAHPIPEHPRPRRVKGRVTLVGDAAGYVTKCSGEGIYFAAKSGRMAGEAIVEATGGKKMVSERDLRVYLDRFDNKYWATYKVLDILQKVFYRSNPAREAFVELCKDDYVQKMTFDSYLYKTVVPGNPIDDIKLLGRTVASIVRCNALRPGKGLTVSFGSDESKNKAGLSA